MGAVGWQGDFCYNGRDASLVEAGTDGVADGDEYRGAGGKNGEAGLAPPDSSHGGAGGGYLGKPGKVTNRAGVGCVAVKLSAALR